MGIEPIIGGHSTIYQGIDTGVFAEHSVDGESCAKSSGNYGVSPGSRHQSVARSGEECNNVGSKRRADAGYHPVEKPYPHWFGEDTRCVCVCVAWWENYRHMPYGRATPSQE